MSFRDVLTHALVLFSVAAFAAGCPDDTDPSEEPDETTAIAVPLGYLTTPATLALPGKQYRYRPVVATAEDVTWSVQAGPDGLAFDEDGEARWVPGVEAGGDHDVTLRATAGDSTADQTYALTVLTPEIVAEASIVACDAIYETRVLVDAIHME